MIPEDSRKWLERQVRISFEVKEFNKIYNEDSTHKLCAYEFEPLRID